MTKQKSTKKALLSSVLALVLCLSMLIGTTFAWFTDSVTSGKNIISAGNLDIELEYLKDNDWVSVDGATDLFKDALWEPGHAQVVYLKLSNLGSLALKYQLSVDVITETFGTNVDGKTFRLSDYIEYGVVESTTESTYAKREDAVAAVANESIALSNGYVKSGTMLADCDDLYLTLVAYMPESVGNEANYKTDTDVPTIELGINLMATQYTEESDSFNNQYDANATYIEAWDGSVVTPEKIDGVYQINTAAELAGFAELVNGGEKSAKAALNADINLADLAWTPISTEWAYSGTFDGQSHTIYGLNVNAYEAGLFGVATGTVKNVNVVGATVKGSYHAAAIVGTGYASIQNCHVTDSTIVGNYAGGLSGYNAAGKTYKNTVKNCVISGKYASGGLFGLVTADGSNSITKNAVTDCNIYCAEAVGPYYNGIGEVVGRSASSAVVLEGNITKNNNLYAGESVAIVANADEMITAIDAGQGVVLAGNINVNPAELSNAYGATGINVKNGQDIDGNGNTLDVSGANGTWDSSINTTGGTIENITVTGAFRGIFINHNSDYSEKVVLNNVTINAGAYTISCDQGMNQGLTATDCTFNGWTSYAATLGDAEFINCSFGSNGSYAYMRPYASTTLTNCTFSEGFAFDATRTTVVFENCYVGDNLITAENITTLLGESAANATVK